VFRELVNISVLIHRWLFSHLLHAGTCQQKRQLWFRQPRSKHIEALGSASKPMETLSTYKPSLSTTLPNLSPKKRTRLAVTVPAWHWQQNQTESKGPRTLAAKIFTDRPRVAERIGHVGKSISHGQKAIFVPPPTFSTGRKWGFFDGFAELMSSAISMI
jgi:hypothetical protein